MEDTKILLKESEIPTSWYNIQADMPTPVKPPLSPVTGKPATPEELGAIFPEEIIKQEVSTERFIEIPEEVQKLYRLWRPSPVYRAHRLEKALDTPAGIYFKYEGVSPAGSHKLNTAIPQAYYNKKQGIRRLATETGAGQWGTALSMACKFFDMECSVYMVKVSYEQKPYRRSIMQLFGAEVFASPTDKTDAGRAVLKEHPDSLGSLGIAISEAVEDAVKNSDTNYALGSVLNHVVLHQTVIGLEAKKQMEKAGYYPDVVIACSGGGSNFGGIAMPFVHDKIKDGKKTRIIAAEPAACPSLTKGKFTYDYGDVAHLTPKMMMYTLGSDFVPPGIHAGGLRYHGASPIQSQLLHDELIEAVAYDQQDIFEAAMLFAQNEGIVPAPESAHAIKAAIDEALKAKEAGEKKTILFNLSGHGYFDMASYDNYLSGKLQNSSLSDDVLQETLSKLQ
ncbi:Tryptophan synthase beta chain 2 [Tepidanaerobacter acetatoxydans Re1]|uniref:Tryptophan synthase beta chain n=1 Tax=Tepidanaerobacter acetatoxydans (strain DSM 21804 / JCM 16047 / Re1) TaxID=1209989 RepID=F4LS94_TEPAE|nr:TrpB-like pyridoxal phosphate-dependent enzyme [Tepidanaerobacter acetatoxydans]AEE90357.1 Tryptophan synthase beta chain [Tepidanaerobacter acetatoxydans Re1]CCP24848.1 Tryptophan synthase beta chain 2 [Tepidanaerobacter acetatoxydans Re1]